MQPGDMDKARAQIADVIGQILKNLFYGRRFQADNWALKATFEAYAEKRKSYHHLKIEHHAILHTCEYLEGRGAEITYLDVDENGFVDPKAVEAAITDKTVLISVMTANNEIGTIEPIREIGRIAHEHGILFHTDAVQAFGQIPISVDADNIDMLSSSGHKLNGYKGYRIFIHPQGRQDPQLRTRRNTGTQKRRAGTENVQESSVTAQRLPEQRHRWKSAQRRKQNFAII